MTQIAPNRIALTGARLLDPEAGTLLENRTILIEDGRITDVAEGQPAPDDAEAIALDGKVVMPGMIDCHMHVVAETLDLWANMIAPSSLAGLRAARVMEETLDRGFTTIRDLGGADHGLVRGVEEGLIDGPRLIICGKGLSTTGGHCDLRARTDDRPGIMSDRLGSMGILVDGTDDVRRVSRTYIKEGARFIKLMANGGVSSPNDPIHTLQFSRDEILAAVEEAENAGLYVSAHVYTDRAIRRCVELGVHSLEHCNLIEAETAMLAAEKGCIAVPTLVAYEALALEGAALGLGPDSVAKIDTVREGGRRSLAIMRDAGLEMAFGSDLLGELRKYHCMEVDLLAEVLTPAEILRSLTTIGAKLCGLEGEAGVIAPGASADLLVLDGNPLDDISLLTDDGANFRAVMARGRFVRSDLEGDHA
ncbi:metal-dependent hydrolase family protein [Pelagovum pacificum]|uniref:Amidohydrolase family protein n=1 Tax=Pelagovum pacificum TaxID=2588711 RepID=A0A5C5G8Z0_9RHOB|nr:amidohydrolase family protein [Pelagovum pacificum]QQA41747.1 amidohydrolase family protein [Pelagovum pacificum]TNY31021.1 amidohydrolase family protein [Pelagovum pacificum]